MARVAIVTGAARGLGAGIAHALLAARYNVTVVDALPAVHDVFAEAVSDGRVLAQCVDLSVPGTERRLLEETLNAFGRCDAVVNNAGIGGPHLKVADLDDASVHDVLAINLLAALRLCRAALPALRQSGSGRVVNIGSVFAERPSVADAAYGMSKAALAALTRSLALEEGAHGITANTVAPGYMLTEMHREEATRMAAAAATSVDLQLAELRNRVPVPRHGTADDVGSLVTWLLSPHAGYVSGQVLRVDGALSIA
ncbi:SDR family NAD(P)-dependent oxidoreductase [Microbacterium xylanilyticum]